MQGFYKYEGAGNDFVVIDGRRGGFEPSRARVARLCDRHFGIGADGLMILENDTAGQSPQAEFRMRYFNADGGESTMCGNGGRCIALFAHHLGIGGRHKVFRGVDGIHSAELLSADAEQGLVRLGMIDVDRVEREDNHCILDTGSPHYVEFVPDVDRVDVCSRGAMIRHSDRFRTMGGVNVNFAEVVADGHIRVRTFERGVENETLACGTGATAAAIAAAAFGESLCRKWLVKVPGGQLEVTFETTDRKQFTRVGLTGPARKVFAGEIELK